MPANTMRFLFICYAFQMQILSDNSIVRQCLETIAQTVLENGGEIHPDLIIHHSGANLWITCQQTADNATLLQIPNELFIPVSELDWHAQGADLCYQGDTGSLSVVQLQLLNEMVALYNHTGKLSKVAHALPSNLLPDDPKLLAVILSAHPTFSLSKRNPARQFIDTRLNEQMAEGHSDKLVGYLMPLIDLLNHHPYAPNYERTESGAWRIPVAYPVPGSDMCYVRYSKFDSLYIAMWHGYFDPYTRHVASVECSIHHNEIGDVRIRSTTTSRRKINAPKLLPGETNLTLQDLVLEKAQRKALITLLGLAVRSIRRTMHQSEAEIIANELVALLVDANIQKYSELLALCQTETEHFPLRPLFGQVAEHQLMLLEDLRVV
jgi:hypothetical protein